MAFPAFDPTIIRKTKHPPQTIEWSCLQILQPDLSFRSGGKLILIAYIPNGDCCYELWQFRELPKIAKLNDIATGSVPHCCTTITMCSFHIHQSFASFMTLTIKSEEVLLLCDHDHELDVSDIDVCVWYVSIKASKAQSGAPGRSSVPFLSKRITRMLLGFAVLNWVLF